MFYLIYRPQTIEEIDNEVVRERIKIMLRAKRVPHALLFTGPKGTGKTSTARIVAKVINCENNLYNKKSDFVEPCNRCYSCQSITAGSAIDIMEIDAASNRKIDETRDLINQVKFSPVHSRYKVYIIDEVHMLTPESFNALLKTLEEPPPSTIFILASTEIDKLPKTIVSRCLKFNFGKAKEAEILRMLKRIAKSENIKTDDGTLKFIAKYSDNSFRDAAKLLEEVVINYSKPTIDNVKKILGLKDEHSDLIRLLEKKELKKIFEFIENYEKSAGNFKILIEYLLDKLHLILLKKNHLETDLEEDYNFSLKEITRLMKLLQEAYNSLKYSPIESLPLEIAMVEYFENNK